MPTKSVNPNYPHNAQFSITARSCDSFNMEVRYEHLSFMHVNEVLLILHTVFREVTICDEETGEVMFHCYSSKEFAPKVDTYTHAFDRVIRFLCR